MYQDSQGYSAVDCNVAVSLIVPFSHSGHSPPFLLQSSRRKAVFLVGVATDQVIPKTLWLPRVAQSETGHPSVRQAAKGMLSNRVVGMSQASQNSGWRLWRRWMNEDGMEEEHIYRDEVCHERRWNRDKEGRCPKTPEILICFPVPVLMQSCNKPLFLLR